MTEAENPIGTLGFEFIEFAPAQGAADAIRTTFAALGFSLVARHRSQCVELYRQGGVNFLLNETPASPAAHFAHEHGASASAMGFRVKDAKRAYEELLRRGGEPAEIGCGIGELRLPAIRGIGGALIYLCDERGGADGFFDVNFDFIPGAERHPEGCLLQEIDHLTHNVFKGRMDYWANYYTQLFNFREIRYFDIKGEYTGLHSRAMSGPEGKIRIPLNEESSRGTGQIQEFLTRYNGEGIQHVALTTDNIYETIDRLRRANVPMMTPPPSAYYEDLDERLPKHGEPLADMQRRGILIDGSTEGGDLRILLQIFTETLIGPIFIEIIQRKRNEGFGEGNFTALFKSMERDQVRRGVIEAA
ncbi:MAG: 4-hydroxyphenylpyruvate dioxygenase [Terricaulis sp.]